MRESQTTNIVVLFCCGTDSTVLRGNPTPLRGRRANTDSMSSPRHWRAIGAPESDAAVDDVQPSFPGWIAQAATAIDCPAATCAEVSLCGISTGATLTPGTAPVRSTKINGHALISATLILDGWNFSRWRCPLPLASFAPLGRSYRHRERPPYGVKNERLAWFAEKVQFRHL
jgi:carboxylesterase